ncbi:2Fe-2S iron-sulfur cluster-binding protein [Ammoniphilus sp. CFH 90114]|uniref:2Fe-2S iron-sulfur cluster-binding protein n=1 Tax=Ammoniphilus sp. CFH 90114 TaxID=2493665 RepID=UPI00100F8D82|nr:2Fe-2S iron-sulfur cluster-binding protein [Ammoniphilus sp. CFH 90114]RXT13893.1 (2Fe-2S)-binding protein [Ammoniphilus sp. CFH 90114]
MRIKIEFQPRGKTISVNKGDNLLQSALKNRIAIRNRCRGNGTCTNCKIQIMTLSPFVSMPSSQELRMIGEEEMSEGFRLACQTRVYGPIQVRVPEEAWKNVVKSQIQQQKENEGI